MLLRVWVEDICRCVHSTVKSEGNLWRVSSFLPHDLRNQTQALLAASDFLCWAISLVLKLQYILVWVYKSFQTHFVLKIWGLYAYSSSKHSSFSQLFLPVSTIHNSSMCGNHTSHAALDRLLTERQWSFDMSKVLPQLRYNQTIFFSSWLPVKFILTTQSYHTIKKTRVERDIINLR